MLCLVFMTELSWIVAIRSNVKFMVSILIVIIICMRIRVDFEFPFPRRQCTVCVKNQNLSLAAKNTLAVWCNTGSNFCDHFDLPCKT